MIVIDASVANKLVLNEEGHDSVQEIFQNHILGIETIIVPDFLLYEVANTLAIKGGLSSNKVTSSLTKIYRAYLNIYHCGEVEVKVATKLAKKYKTSVYDMLYAVVAQAHKISLITADGQFIKQSGFKFVKRL